jgi:hypothetical protein
VHYVGKVHYLSSDSGEQMHEMILERDGEMCLFQQVAHECGDDIMHVGTAGRAPVSIGMKK